MSQTATPALPPLEHSSDETDAAMAYAARDTLLLIEQSRVHPKRYTMLIKPDDERSITIVLNLTACERAEMLEFILKMCPDIRVALGHWDDGHYVASLYGPDAELKEQLAKGLDPRSTRKKVDESSTEDVQASRPQGAKPKTIIRQRRRR